MKEEQKTAQSEIPRHYSTIVKFDHLTQRVAVHKDN